MLVHPLGSRQEVPCDSIATIDLRFTIRSFREDSARTSGPHIALSVVQKMLFSAGLIGLLLPLAAASIDGQVHQLHARQAIPSSPSGSNSTSNVTITPTQTVLTGDGANVTVQGGFARRSAVDSAPFRITDIALVEIQV
jgi:hypothetical protein